MGSMKVITISSPLFLDLTKRIDMSVKTTFSWSKLLLVAGALGLGACQQDAPQEAISTPEATQVELTTDVDDMTAILPDEARMLIQERATGSQPRAGIRYAWKVGEKELVHILLKQGSVTKTTTGTLTFGKHNSASRSYTGKLVFTLPAGINPANGTPVQLAGALGASEIKNGRAVIPPSQTLIESGRSYTPPMYFPPTTLQKTITKTGAVDYTASVSVKAYGSILTTTISNKGGNMHYYPHEITYYTQAFTTTGEMDLFSATSTTAPIWFSDQSANAVQRVAFEQGEVRIGQEKTYYLWVKPSMISRATSLKAEIRTESYSKELGALAVDATAQWTVKQMADKKVYRLPKAIQAPRGDLIISEVYMANEDYNTAWEFYNPTNVTLKLSDYELWRYRVKTGDRYNPEANPDDRANLGAQQHYGDLTRKILVDNHTIHGTNELEVAPHKTVLFTSTALTGVNKQYAAQLQPRPGLAYWIATGTAAVGGAERISWRKAFYLEQHSLHLLVRKTQTRSGYEAVDSFFWYADNSKPTYPAITFMRKPNRNIPRKRMAKIANSDWVARKIQKHVDWGYRFSYYADNGTTSWLGGTATAGAVTTNPLLNVDFSGGGTRNVDLARFRQTPYAPPIWWTKARAEAADKFTR